MRKSGFLMLKALKSARHLNDIVSMNTYTQQYLVNTIR